MTQQQSSITCPNCGKTSYNPNDVRNQYCGYCHSFHIQVCDFCSDSPPTHTIPCRSFSVDLVPGLESVDAWMACDTCFALIEAQDREGLVERGVKSFLEREMIEPVAPEHILRQVLRGMHDQFWASRIKIT